MPDMGTTKLPEESLPGLGAPGKLETKTVAEKNGENGAALDFLTF
jgi:hypothetical protein